MTMVVHWSISCQQVVNYNILKSPQIKMDLHKHNFPLKADRR